MPELVCQLCHVWGGPLVLMYGVLELLFPLDFQLFGATGAVQSSAEQLEWDWQWKPLKSC